MPQTEDPPPKKKRGCLRWLWRLALLSLILLAAFLLWLNGPGFRWIGEKYGPGFLSKAGFKADFTLSGTLWKGPVIDNLTLTSSKSPLKRIEAKNLRLRYDPFQLKNLQIESLSADSLLVDIDLAQTAPKKDKPKKESAPWDELLEKYRPLALHPELQIRSLDLHIHQGETNFYQLTQASLSHSAGSEDFLIEPGTVTDFENQTFQAQTVTLSWPAGGFLISQFPAAQKVAITNLQTRYSPVLQANGSIQIYDSLLEIESDGKSYARFNISQSQLPLEPFFRFLPEPPPLTGRVTELNGTITNLDQPFEAWQADLTLGLESNEWRARTVPDLLLTFKKRGLVAKSDLRLALPGKPFLLDLNTELPPDLLEQPSEAWQRIITHFDSELPSVQSLLTALQPHLNLTPPKDGWPEGSATLNGSIHLAPGGLGRGVAKLDLKNVAWAEARFPSGTLDVKYSGHDSPIKADLLLRQDPDSTLTATAIYDREEQRYDASLSADDFMAESLQPFIALAKPDFSLAGTITLNWKGTGILSDQDSHRGELNLTQTRLSIDEQPPVTFEVRGQYEGTENVAISQLTLAQADQLFSGSLNWDGERLILPDFNLMKSGLIILNGKASLPLELGKLDPRTYLAQNTPWNLELNANELNIPATAALFALQIPEGLEGTATIDTSISGSPAQPSFSGRLRIDDARYNEVKQLPQTDISLSWATAGQNFTLGGTITPEGRQAIALDASTAFRPGLWVEEPERIWEETFKLRAVIPSTDLAEFASLSPVIKSLTGTANGELIAQGTFRSPQLEGSLDIDLPRARLKLPRFNQIRESNFKARFSGQTVTILPSVISAEGGLFELSGTIGLQDTKNPNFAIDLTAKNALIWRDDNINSRTNAAISVRGTLQSAQVDADIGIVESLFYKDIEILPVGVPVSVPKSPTLPSLGRPTTGSSNKIPLPEPFASWTLNAKATTTDPFIIRGNLTSGEVQGTLTAKGKLGEPQLNGSLVIQDFVANLPFSKLTINGGTANFTPNSGFIPTLDILAESSISPYQVDLFVYGKATSPKISLTSSPSLPENEIITLLATGVTPEGLEDTDTARGKLFQLFIERIRRAPPGTYTNRFIRPLVEPLKDVEFQVAGADPFTGKKRNSITIPVHKSRSWYFSAAVDSENNTRFLFRRVKVLGDSAKRKKKKSGSTIAEKASANERTEVRILGLSGLSEKEVLTRLAGRLDFVTSRPPDRASADDADFLVRRLLEKEGYPEVDLTWRIPADRKSIVLTVNSGPRFTLGTITFPGAPAGTETDMSLFFTGKKAFGKVEAPYILSKTLEATKDANDYLRSLGYWNSSMTLREPIFDRSNQTVQLTIATDPGLLHTITHISIEGQLPHDAPQLPELIKRNIGSPATSANMRKVREGSAAHLRRQGYQFAETFLTADHSNGHTKLTLILDPGRKYTLRRALLTGAPKIDLTRVQRRLDRSIGEAYNQEMIDRVQRTLQGTGAFSSVRAERETNRDEATITATLRLAETKTRGISYNLGGGSFEGFIVGASYYNRNFLGKLYNFSAAAEYSGIGFLGEVSVSDPFFMGYDLRATPRAFILSRTYDEYSKLESGLGITFSYDLDKKNKFELDANLSFSSVTAEKLPVEALGVTDYLLATVGATWIHEDRDSPVSPGEGFYSRVRAEFGAVGADEPNLFFRLEGQASYHWPISDRGKLAFNLRTGILAPLEQGDFPVDLRYFLGGPDSVRSAATRELGPKASGVPRGGQAFWYGNIEYVHQLAGILYGVVFFDAGSLDESSLNWPSLDPDLAIGAGLRIDLPIGPIRLEYGQALNPSANDPSGTFHFAIGASF